MVVHKFMKKINNRREFRGNCVIMDLEIIWKIPFKLYLSMGIMVT